MNEEEIKEYIKKNKNQILPLRVSDYLLNHSGIKLTKKEREYISKEWNVYPLLDINIDGAWYLWGDSEEPELFSTDEEIQQCIDFINSCDMFKIYKEGDDFEAMKFVLGLELWDVDRIFYAQKDEDVLIFCPMEDYH